MRVVVRLPEVAVADCIRGKCRTTIEATLESSVVRVANAALKLAIGHGIKPVVGKSGKSIDCA